MMTKEDDDDYHYNIDNYDKDDDDEGEPDDHDDCSTNVPVILKFEPSFWIILRSGKVFDLTKQMKPICSPCWYHHEINVYYKHCSW